MLYRISILHFYESSLFSFKVGQLVNGYKLFVHCWIYLQTYILTKPHTLS